MSRQTRQWATVLAIGACGLGAVIGLHLQHLAWAAGS